MGACSTWCSCTSGQVGLDPSHLRGGGGIKTGMVMLYVEGAGYAVRMLECLAMQQCLLAVPSTGGLQLSIVPQSPWMQSLCRQTYSLCHDTALLSGRLAVLDTTRRY